MTALDAGQFRRALGNFVTGVTIVTARADNGAPVGLTVNSFNSVSLDPPLVLWSLSLKSGSLPAFRDAPAWAVHVLAAGQEEISSRFATPGVDKFAGLDCRDGPEGAPFLEGCAARFGCKAAFEYEGGDHAIFVGHVVDLDARDAEPLIYHGGDYGRVMRRDGKDGSRDAWARLAQRGLLKGERSNWSLTEEGRAMLGDIAEALSLDPAEEMGAAQAKALSGAIEDWLAGLDR